ncbi:hypothetical protein ACTWP4_08130 [Gracilibacillus sp. D59]|uniref:hypothetical protein n=1 Tax=Gracilibacillus sp. D59 TaxID=3457434 RepID=UPI003FCC8A15
MDRKMNSLQVLFTSFFVLIVLAVFIFLVPDFNYKSITFIILGGVSTFIGGRLSFLIIKDIRS